MPGLVTRKMRPMQCLPAFQAVDTIIHIACSEN
jgi:hypothetical protein